MHIANNERIAVIPERLRNALSNAAIRESISLSELVAMFLQGGVKQRTIPSDRLRIHFILCGAVCAALNGGQLPKKYEAHDLSRPPSYIHKLLVESMGDLINAQQLSVELACALHELFAVKGSWGGHFECRLFSILDGIDFADDFNGMCTLSDSGKVMYTPSHNPIGPEDWKTIWQIIDQIPMMIDHELSNN